MDCTNTLTPSVFTLTLGYKPSQSLYITLTTSPTNFKSALAAFTILSQPL
jgi:hypothetical protein